MLRRAIIFLIVLVGLIFFAPTIGIPLLKWLLGRAKKLANVAVKESSRQFKQVVDGVQKYRTSPDVDDEHKEFLDALLKEHTDSATREKIRKLKNGGIHHE